MQPCTQPPRQDATIVGFLSMTYTLIGEDEPTLASLGLEPDFFVKHFQSIGNLSGDTQQSVQHQPGNTQQNLQHQPAEVESIQRQGEPDLRDGEVVSGYTQQPTHYSGGGAVEGAVEVAAPMGPNEQSQPIQPLALSEDVAMGD